MHQEAIISSFIRQLEYKLGYVFQIHRTSERWLLLPPKQLYTILVYLEQGTRRTPCHTTRCFHLDIDQIVACPSKLTNRLSTLLGQGQIVYARQTVVARIDKKVSLTFQQEHHLQVALPGKYRYGLFYQGELVSVAIFSGGRRLRDIPESQRSFELIRFCHKSDLRVVGGLSKLIKAFSKDFHPHDIMTYVDNDWAQKSNLQTIGFRPVSQLEPQSFWVDNNERHYVHESEHFTQLQQQYPQGYLKYNSGSTKLVLTL